VWISTSSVFATPPDVLKMNLTRVLSADRGRTLGRELIETSKFRHSYTSEHCWKQSAAHSCFAERLPTTTSLLLFAPGLTGTSLALAESSVSPQFSEMSAWGPNANNKQALFLLRITLLSISMGLIV
jgi:hypothetical protein